DGKFVIGTFTFPDGRKYLGEFGAYDTFNGQGILTIPGGRIFEGIWAYNKFKYAQNVSQNIAARLTPPSTRVRPPPTSKSDPPPKSDSTGSGFFVSKLGHVVTNQHVVDKCKSVTVGDNANNQVTARVLETDRRNDLALLRISSMQMASAETKTLIRKLGIKVVPLATNGLMRSEDVELGDGQ
ncbi:MAG: trypsin-like peptidase domain-containing protein, partial [Rhodospirillales bacterium]|nr:trypsin-like peptidase domain-containing protein [Rhodospirillales bacterium]